MEVFGEPSWFLTGRTFLREPSWKYSFYLFSFEKFLFSLFCFFFNFFFFFFFSSFFFFLKKEDFFDFFLFFKVLYCPLQEIRVALPGSVTAAARAELPIPISVCSIFLCPDNGMAARVWDFNVRTDVDAGDRICGLHEHRKKICNGKLALGKKIPCRTGDSNLQTWLFSRTLYPLGYIPIPFFVNAELKLGKR